MRAGSRSRASCTTGPPPLCPTSTTRPSSPSTRRVTAATWSARVTCARSAAVAPGSRPGRVTGWGTRPAASRWGTTSSQAQAPSQKPGTRTTWRGCSDVPWVLMQPPSQGVGDTCLSPFWGEQDGAPLRARGGAAPRGPDRHDGPAPRRGARGERADDQARRRRAPAGRADDLGAGDRARAEALAARVWVRHAAPDPDLPDAVPPASPPDGAPPGEPHDGTA